MQDARSVANALIEKSLKQGEQPFTPLQIIKMTYYCQGWMLAFNEKSLFHQPVEAWRFGPVVADVYHALKHWGRQPIRRPIDDFESGDFNSVEQDVIDMVYDYYKQYSGIELSALTHNKGTPWDQIWSKNSTYLWQVLGKTTIIPNDLIKHYYKSVASENGWDGTVYA